MYSAQMSKYSHPHSINCFQKHNREGMGIGGKQHYLKNGI